MKLNLDLVDEAVHAGQKFAIVIHSKDELEELGAIIHSYARQAWNPWYGEELHDTWTRYSRNPGVEEFGLAVTLGFAGGRFLNTGWCWTSYYVKEGYTIVDFEDLLNCDEIEIGQPLVAALFGGVSDA